MPIVWTNPDGTVQITSLEESWLARERLPRETTEEAVLRLSSVIQAKAPSLTGTPSLVTSASLPANRRWRNAWRLDGSSVHVALPEAKDLCLAEVRAARNNYLKDSDALLLREQEQGGSKVDAYLTYRQELRDIPGTVASLLVDIKSEEELTAWQPTWPVKP